MVQEFDPDLPPELAAAAGYHDISTDNGRLSKSDNGQIDVNSQGRGPANVRPPLVRHLYSNIKYPVVYNTSHMPYLDVAYYVLFGLAFGSTNLFLKAESSISQAFV